jgi:hypothetical protein
MERSRMPDNTAGASMPVRPLPVLPETRLDISGTWQERAICREEVPDIFFPVCGDPGTEARQVCARCPVRIHCLEYAIAKDEWGIWGGLDRDQRRALRDVIGEQGSPLDITARSCQDGVAHD